MTSRNYCFTTFVTDLYDSDKWCEIPEIKYLIYQLEQCPKSGKIHLQGYCELNKPMRIGAFKKLMDDSTMHCEKRLGTRDQARNYCCKDDTRFKDPKEFGDFEKSQGSRTDLERVVDIINEHGKKSLDVICEEEPTAFIKFNRGIEKLISMKNNVARNFKTEVHIWYGATGKGKSGHIMKLFPDAYILPTSDIKGGKVWWNDYNGEDVVIINDFYGEMGWNYLLNLCDRYKFLVETKGGMRNFCSKKIFFTSNKSWKLWYDEEKFDHSAFLRRINTISYFPASGDAVVEYRKKDVDVLPECNIEVLQSVTCYEVTG